MIFVNHTVHTNMLRLKVNGGKCQIMGLNCEEEKLRRWVDLVGCDIGLSSYLGLSLGGNSKADLF